ncbi:MAG: hypothetical protein LBR73_07060 [Oscillospiraceae bacterium]|nr:hypothetical protein [Oscillospiraceae bacterium]
MKNKHRKATHANQNHTPAQLPAGSAARLPDTQAPKSVLNPQSRQAVNNAKRWVDENEL